MDDVYEFENSEYRLASMQIKAIAYDVMTGITRKKGTLKGKDTPIEVLNKLTLISDRIVELTDSLEEELEKLDQTIENYQLEKSTAKEETTQITQNKNIEQVQPSEENQKETKLNSTNLPPVEVKEPQEDTQKITPQNETVTPKEPREENSTVPMPEPKPEMNNVQENPSKEEPPAPKTEESVTPSTSVTPEKSESEIPQLPEIKKIEKVDSSLSTTNAQDSTQQPAKKRLQKTTKNLSKAIMVRPNQLENLRKSRKYQEQLVAKQGIFEMVDKAEETNPITQAPKQLPDEVERQIEDLTVKANIYYNEGEADKAQELYDKIRQLNEQYR